MSHYLLFILVIASFELSANSNHKFKIDGKVYNFIMKDNLLVSIPCLKGCIAITRVKSLKTIKSQKKDSKYGTSLGSYHCKHSLRGRSVLGVIPHGDMRAFCYFDDDESLIEINSLSKFITDLK